MKERDMNFEDECLQEIKQAIVRGLQTNTYTVEKTIHEPLAAAMRKHAATIESQFDVALTEILSDNTFKDAIKEQVRKTLARSIVSGMQGSCDKVVQKLKADPVRGAMLIQAVNSVLSQFDPAHTPAAAE
jgi:hypothetical protein